MISFKLRLNINGEHGSSLERINFIIKNNVNQSSLELSTGLVILLLYKECHFKCPNAFYTSLATKLI